MLASRPELSGGSGEGGGVFGSSFTEDGTPIRACVPVSRFSLERNLFVGHRSEAGVPPALSDPTPSVSSYLYFITRLCNSYSWTRHRPRTSLPVETFLHCVQVQFVSLSRCFTPVLRHWWHSGFIVPTCVSSLSLAL